MTTPSPLRPDPRQRRRPRRPVAPLGARPGARPGQDPVRLSGRQRRRQRGAPRRREARRHALHARTPAVVENKPGAGGRIARGDAEGLAGRRLGADAGAGVGARRSIRYIYPKLSYKPEDVAPVSIGAIMFHGLAVGPAVPAEREDAQGLPRLGQGQSGAGQLRLAGRGLDAALAGRAARPARGVELKHVPYRGSRARHHRPGRRPDRRRHEPERRLPAVHEGRQACACWRPPARSARPTCPTCPPSPNRATRIVTSKSGSASTRRPRRPPRPSPPPTPRSPPR